MKLREKNLKRIIRFIEEFGAIDEVKIKNNSTTILSPAINGELSKVTEIDLNRANKIEISFVMGDIKEDLIWKQNLTLD